MTKVTNSLQSKKLDFYKSTPCNLQCMHCFKILESVDDPCDVCCGHRFMDILT